MKGVPTRPFGPTGREVPVLGQGTWQLDLASRPTAVEALRRGLDLGLRHIDTAEMYGSGRVEELVGEAIAGRRDEVFLVTKVVPQNASREGTARSCEASLKRLGTDHVDLYLLHWPGSHPLEETVAAFEELRDRGKIRFWGVSNFDVAELEKVQAVAGPGRIACNQVCYHVKARTVEHTVLPWCQERGVAVVAYSPFGSGQFPGPHTRSGQALGDIGRRHDASAHQVALAFLTRHPGVFAIPKAVRRQHVEQNAAAARLQLGGDDLDQIELVLPAGAPGPLPTI